MSVELPRRGGSGTWRLGVLVMLGVTVLAFAAVLIKEGGEDESGVETACVGEAEGEAEFEGEAEREAELEGEEYESEEAESEGEAGGESGEFEAEASGSQVGGFYSGPVHEVACVEGKHPESFHELALAS